nr:division/cell wall cluster transcriptional repressor MraZ [Hyphomonas sp.]
MYRATLTRLAPHSPARKALVTRIIAGSADLKMDDTGRIKLTEELIKAAGLDGRVKFAGNMDSFQIWNPDRHAEHFDAMAAEAAKEDTLEALGQAYSEVLMQQANGGAALKLVDGGEG